MKITKKEIEKFLVPISSKAASIFYAVIDMAGEDGTVKLDNAEGFVPLSVERIYRDNSIGEIWSFAHYGELNGDLMRDPEMEFLVVGQKVYPISYRLDYVGFYEPLAWLTDSSTLEIDQGLIRQGKAQEQADFAAMWLRNIADQQGVHPKSSRRSSLRNISLSEFLAKYGKVLRAEAKRKIVPLYSPDSEGGWEKKAKDLLSNLGLTPLARQLTRVILPAGKALFKADRKGVFCVGEMGTGKTFMSLAVAYLSGRKNQRILIQCPPHLTEKWSREARRIIPNCKVINLDKDGLKTLLRFKGRSARQCRPDGIEVFVLSREKAKLTFRARKGYVFHSHLRTFRCPACGSALSGREFKAVKAVCSECGERLWQADPTGIRRFALAEFIGRYLPKGFIDFLILDEVHELKGGDTAQGQTMAYLIKKAKKVFPLTGTLLGGYSSNIFFLLYRLFPRKMQERGIGYGEILAFARQFGVIEETYRTSQRVEIHDPKVLSIARGGRKVSVREAPGISPLVLTEFLLENSVFIRLSDVAEALPPYEEIAVPVEMDEEGRQKAEYQALSNALAQACKEALRKGDMSLLGKMLQSLLAYPDGCRNEEVVEIVKKAEDGTVLHREHVFTASALDYKLLPKEKMLLSLIKDELSKGRKVCVYLEHTGTRDLIPTLEDKLSSAGIRPLVLRSSVPTSQREAWLNQKMSTGKYDCLLCNPRLVQTGLDLLEFPTLIFYQTGYSVYTLRQASRRSWRIGQKQPVRVYFLAYDKTMQATALSLVASKLEASVAIEGDISGKGLAELSQAETGLIIEMARTLTEGAKVKSVADAFVGLRKAELEAAEDLGSEISTETCTTIEETTTVSVGDKQKVSVKVSYLVRGTMYFNPRQNQAVAYVGRERFVFRQGKIYWRDRQVGHYDRKGHGELNGKRILIYRHPRIKRKYLLAEVLKDFGQEEAA